ncbi:MAG: polysaccharide biosynthesis tyrosine autokinase [Dechloromonas sp.]|nr:polysaccharide biosynthesis tyrosine autokinase [Dechloromonas sp.]
MDMNQAHTVKDFLAPTRCLGAILIDAGRMSQQQVGQVVQLQKQEGLRFGEAARQLGILDAEDILFGLARQFEYSCLPAGDSAVSPEVLAAFGAQHPLVEGLRDVRSQLMLRWMEREPARKSLAVVSARRGEGKSLIVANLAVLFAQLGQRTLLVDADLLHPRQHSLFNLDNRAGLSSVLSGLAGLQAAVPIPRLDGLAVLSAGPTPPNPRELLSRSRFAAFIGQATQAFDVVLIDTPSAALADAQIIATHAGATILVSRPNAVTIAETAALVRGLDNVFGAVVNEF